MTMCDRAVVVVDVGAKADAADVRRVVFTTRAFHRSRALWMTGGCNRQSCDVDGVVRTAPLILRELVNIARAVSRVGTTQCPPSGSRRCARRRWVRHRRP